MIRQQLASAHDQSLYQMTGPKPLDDKNIVPHSGITDPTRGMQSTIAFAPASAASSVISKPGVPASSFQDGRSEGVLTRSRLGGVCEDSEECGMGSEDSRAQSV